MDTTNSDSALEKALVQQQELIFELEDMRESKVIIYFLSDRKGAEASIRSDVIPVLVEHLYRMREDSKLDIVLYSAGGDQKAAREIADILSRFSSNVNVLVPFKALGHSVLIANNASSIVVTPMADLGSIESVWSTNSLKTRIVNLETEFELGVEGELNAKLTMTRASREESELLHRIYKRCADILDVNTDVDWGAELDNFLAEHVKCPVVILQSKGLTHYFMEEHVVGAGDYIEVDPGSWRRVEHAPF